MSYSTINICAADEAFRGRLTAALADEGETNPQAHVYDVLWFVCSRDDIEAAYASALAAGNENPGGDESVISDQMILSAVQAAPAPTP